MNKASVFLFFSIITLFYSCGKDSLCNCGKRTGPIVSETRNCASFSEIEMNNNIDLVVIPDTFCSVQVTCGANLLDGITTTVENGRLILHNKNKCNWLRDLENRFTVTATVKQLSYLVSNGTGDIHFSDTLRTTPFLFESINATGDYHLLFNCDRVELKLHTGPADIYASGYAKDLYLYSVANGYAYAKELKTETCTVHTESTGDTYVNASTSLHAEIGYTGDVYYSGSASTVRTGNGSGNLIQLN
ncbi:MAG TPA: head GIN domain-containing protein [Bacteroidia bacterium]|nr:head GIN domain-containing protein [Bacteroidia bacterium]